MILYILVIILLISYIIFFKYESFINYKQCFNSKKNKSLRDKINHILGGDLNKDNTNWDIFIPCGYTFVESELDFLSIDHKNQKIFGINGCDLFSNKLTLYKIMFDKFGNNYTKYLPRSYENTYEGLNTLLNNHRVGKKYIVKKNIQAQKGIYIIHKIRNIYNIFRDNSYVIIQELLNNPFLLDMRKINIRIYLLITCYHNKVSGYIYNDGFMYYTPENYNYLSLSKDAHITTGYISRKVYEKNPLTLQDFYKYLESHGKDSKLLQNNINNLFVNFMSAIHELICNKKIFKNNMSFQLFGADVAPDVNLSVKLIEINKGPDMSSKDIRDDTLKRNVVKNTLKIVEIIENHDNNFIEIW